MTISKIKKKVCNRVKNSKDGLIWPFFTKFAYICTFFGMKSCLPQRWILIIVVNFQALSNGAFKNIEKGVQNGQQLEIWLKSSRSTSFPLLLTNFQSEKNFGFNWKFHYRCNSSSSIAWQFQKQRKRCVRNVKKRFFIST